MKTIDLKEMQRIELELLLELDKVCKKHALRFYIDGGTLLGAYCYEGFIPWDDDIDIKMPRKDYEELVRHRHEFPEYMRLVSPEEDGYAYTFTKINDIRTVLIENPGTAAEHEGCVYLDILPMDGHPSDPKILRKLERYKTLFHGAKTGFSGMKNSGGFLHRAKGVIYSMLYNPKTVYEKMTKLAKKTDYNGAEHVGLLIEGNREKETFRRESLDHAVCLPFEGHDFPASAEYEKHLVTFYGEHILQHKHSHDLPYIAPAHKHTVYWKESECQN